MTIFKWLLLLAAETILTDNLPSKKFSFLFFLSYFFFFFFENSWSASGKKQNPMYCIIETSIKNK